MNNKKWMAILLGGIMAASLAAPCSVSAADKTTITFWHAMGGTNGEVLQQCITRTSERAENIALIAAYMDYLMNLEENNSGLAADNRPISKWKEFGLHKGVLRI